MKEKSEAKVVQRVPVSQGGRDGMCGGMSAKDVIDRVRNPHSIRTLADITNPLEQEDFIKASAQIQNKCNGFTCFQSVINTSCAINNNKTPKPSENPSQLEKQLYKEIEKADEQSGVRATFIAFRVKANPETGEKVENAGHAVSFNAIKNQYGLFCTAMDVNRNHIKGKGLDACKEVAGEVKTYVDSYEGDLIHSHTVKK